MSINEPHIGEIRELILARMSHLLQDQFLETPEMICEESLVAMTSFHGDPELQELCHALERIRMKNFGVCQACKKDISIAKLFAVPTTHFCDSCTGRLNRMINAPSRPTTNPS